MSTRSVIGRAILATDGTYDGQFKGVYHHWDGYPSGLGAHLFATLKGKYKDNLGKMLTWAIDTHSAGWSTIMGSSETEKPECFCHPKRKRRPEPKGNWFTNENVEGDIEWLYIFDEARRLMYVTDTRHKATICVNLDGPEPDWAVVECGEKFERCNHIACHHMPELRDTPQGQLGMQTYLGHAPLEVRDAVAVIVDGKRYKITGSGYSASYSGRKYSKPVLPGAWIGTVVAANGRRLEMPTMIQQNGTYIPYPGVTLVMPATKNTPETIGAPPVSYEVESESKPGVTYTITVQDGHRFCTCPQFKFRGGFCKHLC
jgi:hypothetical protein